MEHTTFAKKTVVLAALGALSLMAATVRAADETETEPDPVKITVEIDGTDTTRLDRRLATPSPGTTSGSMMFSVKKRASTVLRWSRATTTPTPLR